jgi:hypothetical protein
MGIINTQSKKTKEKELINMAIKYYCMPEKKKIIGVLDNCQDDVINKIDKLCTDTGFDFWADERFVMPHSFKAEAIARDGDEYDEEVGKEIVRQKIMKRYYNSHDKRMRLFANYLDELVIKVNKKII